MSDASLDNEFQTGWPAVAALKMDAPALTSSFDEVIQRFADGMRANYDFLDVQVLKGRSSLIHIVVNPKHRRTESHTLITFVMDERERSIAVVNRDEDAFTTPEELSAFLLAFRDGREFMDALRVLKASHEEDADGTLRLGSVRSLTDKDVAVMIPKEEFLRLATTKAGEPLELSVRPLSEKYNAEEKYQYLTACGHVVKISPPGIRGAADGYARIAGSVVTKDDV